MDALLDQTAAIQKTAFIPFWRSLPDANELAQTIPLQSADPAVIVHKLSRHFAIQVALEQQSAAFTNPSVSKKKFEFQHSAEQMLMPMDIFQI